MKTIFVRTDKETKVKLSEIIKRYSKDNQTTISENQMIIKMIKDKHNEQKTN